ncbi:multicopper oxidase domain-containing protein [Streptomyces sp. NPDC005970]|uniref:multicopper oxidase domain-containing protein n=1 Tax=Streptomyces sp. NPDC005970 TaxID=3156723 RepID=UPI0033FC2C12
MREPTVDRRQVLGLGGALGLMSATGLSAAAVLSRRPPAAGAELRSAVPLPLAFRVPLRKAADGSRIPRVLSNDVPAWRRSDAARVRDFSFRAGRMHGGHGWLIGGRPFDPARTDVTVPLGDVEVWRLIADVHHPVHLHLVGFRVRSRSGKQPLPHDAGLKDTVSLRPGESAEIITRFDGYRGRYLFHCHNAEHEDMGMMANLEII